VPGLGANRASSLNQGCRSPDLNRGQRAYEGDPERQPVLVPRRIVLFEVESGTCETRWDKGLGTVLGDSSTPWRRRVADAALQLFLATEAAGIARQAFGVG
jgi:hypothetical protein